MVGKAWSRSKPETRAALVRPTSLTWHLTGFTVIYSPPNLPRFEPSERRPYLAGCWYKTTKSMHSLLQPL